MRGMRPEAPATRRLQRAFLCDLTGVAPRTDAEREAAFARPPRGAVADRWHVYAHGYTARLTEALQLEYAAIAAILGEAAFAALVARYVAVFPPRSFDLANAGDRLARFLEFDAVAADLPFLPELARLERAVARCFTAADAVPVSRQDLRRRAPEEAAALRLALAPGVALFDSSWPLADLWRLRFAEQDGAVSVPIEDRPQRVLVFRRCGRVRVEVPSALEAAIVEAAGTGDATPADLQELTGTPEDAASLAAFTAAFAGRVELGIFVPRRSTGWTGALKIPMEDSR
jgi:hypothetical protein